MQSRIKANSKNDIPITNIDLFPTILEFAGINKNEFKSGGISLVPILEENICEFDRPLYWHFPIYLQASKNHNDEIVILYSEHVLDLL